MNFLREYKKFCTIIVAIMVILVMNYSIKAVTVDVEWSKLYGSPQRDAFNDVLKTSDGGFITVGYTYGVVGSSVSRGYIDGLVVKTDSNGTTEWVNQYGGTSRDEIKAIKQTSDGGYVIAGFTEGRVGSDSTLGGSDGWIMKISNTGVEEWSKQYGSSGNDQLLSIEIASDGSYIAAGYVGGTVSGNPHLGSDDGWIIKVGSDGTEQWSKQYGDVYGDKLTSIVRSVDGYVVAGNLQVSISGGPVLDGWIMKVQNDGTAVWSNHFGDNGQDYLNCIVQTSNGEFVATGHTYGSVDGSPNLGGSDGWAIKVDSNGNQQWIQQYGTADSERLLSIKETADGSFVIVGDAGVDAWIMRLDETGAKKWEKLVSSVGNIVTADYIYHVDNIDKGEYIMSGSTMGDTPTHVNLGNYDGWMLRISESYDLGFDLNGAVGVAPVSQTIIIGRNATEPTSPTRVGFAFKEWNTMPDGTGVKWDFTTNVMPATDVVLYAQWDPVFSLQFDLNGAQDSIPAIQNLVAGAFAQPVNDPIRTGYIFKGWNTAIDGSGSTWDFQSTTMPANNVTLYAQWEPVIYSLSFDLNGAQGVPPASQNLSTGAKAQVVTSPIRSGYTFKHWNTARDGSGDIWNFATSTMPTNNVTLYAQWKVDDSNQGTPIDTGDHNNSRTSGLLLIITSSMFVLYLRRTKRIV